MWNSVKGRCWFCPARGDWMVEAQDGAGRLPGEGALASPAEDRGRLPQPSCSSSAVDLCASGTLRRTTILNSPWRGWLYLEPFPKIQTWIHFPSLLFPPADEHNDVQKKTFTKWINARFSKVTDFQTLDGDSNASFWLMEFVWKCKEFSHDMWPNRNLLSMQIHLYFYKNSLRNIFKRKSWYKQFMVWTLS